VDMVGVEITAGVLFGEGKRPRASSSAAGSPGTWRWELCLQRERTGLLLRTAEEPAQSGP